MLAMTLLADHPKEAALGAEPPDPKRARLRLVLAPAASPTGPGDAGVGLGSKHPWSWLADQPIR